MGKKKDAHTALGRSIIKAHQKKPHSGQQKSWHHTSDLDDGYNWNRLNLNSVTDQNSLDEFLTTAELAGTEFTAEKENIKVVSGSFSGLPTVEEEVAIHRAQEDHKELLGIPRRPPWDSDTTASELEMRERDSFLVWRRQLASLQEEDNVVLTPFERNLDFWRQLWRVIERSDVVVQIVDARNPLLFRCEDLEKYVKEVDKAKENFILLSKADLLTQEQRDTWAEYFTRQGIRVAFWSAIAETERIKLNTEEESMSEGDDDDADNDKDVEEAVIPPESTVEENPHIHTSNAFSRLEQNLEVGLQLGEDSHSTADGMAEGSQSEGIAQTDPAGENTDLRTDGNGSIDVDASGSQGTDAVVAVDNTGNGTAPVRVMSGHLPPQSEEREASASDDESDPEDKMESTTTAEQGSSGRTAHCDGRSSISEDGIVEEGEAFNNGRLVTGEELLEILQSVHSGRKVSEGVTTVGMVGYPNVGKSSTINTLLQEKKVPVSATPGRTKHFQTLFVEPTLCLCDCPGLVMPSFVSSKAEMVINGILPVDQIRDFISPISLICQLIPRRALERFYRINIIKPQEGEDPDRRPTALEFLNAYAYNRGHMTQKGVPASRKVSLLVLKDFVNGRLLYRMPPPGVSDDEFSAVNEPEAREGDDKINPMVPAITAEGTQQKPMTTNTLDEAFFHGTNSTVHKKGMAAIHGLQKAGGQVVYVDQSGAKQVSGKPWKKHNKKNTKEKLRRKYKHLDVK